MTNIGRKYSSNLTILVKLCLIKLTRGLQAHDRQTSQIWFNVGKDQHVMCLFGSFNKSLEFGITTHFI